jgi:hypothetical protein
LTSLGDVIALKGGRFLRKKRDESKYCTIYSSGRARQSINREVLKCGTSVQPEY